MKHFYEGIQGWFNFRDVYDDAIRDAADGARFVEVGAWKGRSTAYLAVEIINSGKKISLHVVDHWRGSHERAHLSDPEVINGTLFRTFLRNLAPVADCIEIMRSDSAAAADSFEDGSVDFLCLDGAHDYDSVKRDLTAWLPKMKPAGTIAGDDWNWSGVRRAVNETFWPPGIEVLGKDRGVHWRVRLPCSPRP